MKRIKLLLSVLIVISFLGITSINAQGTSYSNGYNTPILDTSLNFEAEQKDGLVYTSWETFNRDDDFKYYKVVKSTTTSDPVYPDNGYIKYSTDINFTQFVDAGKNKEKTYYRVCAITYSNNRYCSNVAQVEPTNIIGERSDVGGNTVSPVAKSTQQLSYKSKIKADKLVDSVIVKLKNKNYSDEEIVAKINSLNSKLKELANKKPSYKILINYIVTKFEEKKLDFEDGFEEIENIFKDL